MKHHLVRDTKLFQFFNSFNTPLLIPCSYHHSDTIRNQLLANSKSYPFVCSCDNCIPITWINPSKLWKYKHLSSLLFYDWLKFVHHIIWMMRLEETCTLLLLLPLFMQETFVSFWRFDTNFKRWVHQIFYCMLKSSFNFWIGLISSPWLSVETKVTIYLLFSRRAQFPACHGVLERKKWHW